MLGDFNDGAQFRSPCVWAVWHGDRKREPSYLRPPTALVKNGVCFTDLFALLDLLLKLTRQQSEYFQ